MTGAGTALACNSGLDSSRVRCAWRWWSERWFLEIGGCYSHVQRERLRGRLKLIGAGAGLGGLWAIRWRSQDEGGKRAGVVLVAASATRTGTSRSCVIAMAGGGTRSTEVTMPSSRSFPCCRRTLQLALDEGGVVNRSSTRAPRHREQPASYYLIEGLGVLHCVADTQERPRRIWWGVCT